MKNTVTVIGNLGKGYKFTENAPSLFGGTTAKITYSVAERNGEDTTWYQVSALGAKATAAKALFDAHPGCRVEISGDFNPGEGEIRKAADGREFVQNDWINNASIRFVADSLKFKAQAEAAPVAEAKPARKARAKKTA